VTDPTPKKFDTDKPRYDLLPPKALGLLVDCLTYGAKKYDDYNWRKDGGIDPNRLFAATQRHLWAWKEGEVLDKESGLPHLAHAATNLLMMLDLASRPPVKIPNFSPPSAVAATKTDAKPEPKLIFGAESEAYYWILLCGPESQAYKAVVDSNDWVSLDNTEDNLKFAESLSVMFEKTSTARASTITLYRTPSGHKIRSLLNAKS